MMQRFITLIILVLAFAGLSRCQTALLPPPHVCPDNSHPIDGLATTDGAGKRIINVCVDNNTGGLIMWLPSSGVAGANTALSNLDSVTAINSDTLTFAGYAGLTTNAFSKSMDFNAPHVPITFSSGPQGILLNGQTRSITTSNELLTLTALGAPSGRIASSLTCQGSPINCGISVTSSSQHFVDWFSITSLGRTLNMRAADQSGGLLYPGINTLEYQFSDGQNLGNPWFVVGDVTSKLFGNFSLNENISVGSTGVKFLGDIARFGPEPTVSHTVGTGLWDPVMVGGNMSGIGSEQVKICPAMTGTNPAAVGAINTTTLDFGGSGYAPGDTFRLDWYGSTPPDAVGVVDTVSGGGAVTAYHFSTPGFDINPYAGVGTVHLTGSGDDNLTINVDSVIPNDAFALAHNGMVMTCNNTNPNYYVMYTHGPWNDDYLTETGAHIYWTSTTGHTPGDAGFIGDSVDTGYARNLARFGQLYAGQLQIGGPVISARNWYVTPQTTDYLYGVPEMEFHVQHIFNIVGHLTITNNTGTGPTLDNCTGLNNPGGFNLGCDTANNSSDSVGELWLTAGASNGATTGTVELLFNAAWPMNDVSNPGYGGPYCQVSLRDEGVAWSNGATVKQIAPTGGHNHYSAMNLKWSNNGVALPNGSGGPGHGILYFCVAAP